jgi:hypothetical protein
VGPEEGMGSVCKDTVAPLSNKVFFRHRLGI